MEIKQVISQFMIEGEYVDSVRHGNGHINQTFLVKTQKTIGDKKKEEKFVLQKINNNLFKNVDELMENISNITNFNREKIVKEGGDPDRESLTLIMTKDNKTYFYDSQSQEYYRVYKFIDANSYEIVKSPLDYYNNAVALAQFIKNLQDFDATLIHEVLPNFHNTKVRYENFIKSLELDKMDRAKDIKEEIDFVISRKDYCGRIVDLIKSGKMPLRVTHNDTKLNNVMFDKITGKPLAVIDLDTIMPGSICYDFGDSIRFGCNHCDEDEKDLQKVVFDIELFEYFTKGYLSVLGDTVTDVERKNLAFGSILMTFECGMRFLTDYLDGDTYFRTTRQGQNLDRARTQFKLVSDMEKVYDKMQEIVNKY